MTTNYELNMADNSEQGWAGNTGYPAAEYEVPPEAAITAAGDGAGEYPDPEFEAPALTAPDCSRARTD